MTTPTAPSLNALNVPAWQVEMELAGRRFARFVPFWHFKNRETGAIASFRPVGTPCHACPPRTCNALGLWSGQRKLVEVYDTHPWVFALKAGKLGFTELECAFDAWVALFRHANARVNVFSKNDEASKLLLGYISFGLGKLPPEWGVQFQDGMAGGRTSKSLIMRHRLCGADDLRQFVSYPATTSAAIDVSATHSHVDELSHMQKGKELWNSVSTTVAPGGSCHIVTRGAGDAVYSAELWGIAEATPEHLRGTPMHPYPFFAGFDERPQTPERDRVLIMESGAMSQLGVAYFLPMTAEEALQGDDDSPYIPLDVWDRRHDPSLPLMAPGDKTALILGVDAAVSKDSFAVVGATRHPDRHEDVAIRFARIWRPQDSGGQIDFFACERWLRFMCEGGCQAGHPRSMPFDQAGSEREGSVVPACEYCNAKAFDIPGFNVVQICYDPHQMEDMAQRLKRGLVSWVKAFDQGRERLIADSLMYTRALTGTLTHNGNPDLREHIGNSRAKLQADEDGKMRIVKKSEKRKIDGAVAASMAVKRCLDLTI